MVYLFVLFKQLNVDGKSFFSSMHLIPLQCLLKQVLKKERKLPLASLDPVLKSASQSQNQLFDIALLKIKCYIDEYTFYFRYLYLT